MKTSDWLLAITLGWIGIFLGVVVFFLLCNRGQITITNIKDLFGIIISCVSMLITAFFVIMAVNAYGHSEMIEQKAKQVRELSTSLTDKYNEVNQKIEQVSELSTSLTDKYNDIYERTNKQRDYILRVIKDQNIDYYREVLKNRDNVDEVYKSSCLLALGNGGDASDIKPIEEIANDTKESNIIRKIAQNALEKLRSKFPDE